MYNILKLNVNDSAFEKIWKNFAPVVNRGYLDVNFVQEVIKTMKILRKKGKFAERVWRNVRINFKEF